MNCIPYLSIKVKGNLYERKMIVLAKGMAVGVVTKVAMVIALMVFGEMSTSVTLSFVEY